MGFIKEKSRLINDAFLQNFISSTRFECFFKAFTRSNLSRLKHLRLFALDLKGIPFAQTLNSFSQLEELSLFSFYSGDRVAEFELNLPMLISLQLERVCVIKKLIVDAPLKKVKVVQCAHLNLVIVHGESVEHLTADLMGYTEVKKLKNLQFLFTRSSEIDSTLLSDLDQLKEIHTMDRVRNLLEQKQLYGRTDLKIYLCGLLLNGLDDQTIRSFNPNFMNETLVQLAENQSRLAAWIPFHNYLDYSAIERVVDPEMAIDIVSRFSDLSHFIVYETVRDIERFLGLLKSLPNIVELSFRNAQSQDLFNRLPEHCAVRTLNMNKAPLNLGFLCRLKQLNYLDVRCSLDTQMIRKLFDELLFLSSLLFRCNNKKVAFRVIRNSQWTHPERYKVEFEPRVLESTEVPELETAIQWIFEKTQKQHWI